MANFAAKISTVAMLALASLPIAALPASALAATTVKVADLNLRSTEGVLAYQQRAAQAARDYCRDERRLSAQDACRKGVKAELTEKLAARQDAAARIIAAR